MIIIIKIKKEKNKEIKFKKIKEKNIEKTKKK